MVPSGLVLDVRVLVWFDLLLGLLIWFVGLLVGLNCFDDFMICFWIVCLDWCFFVGSDCSFGWVTYCCGFVDVLVWFVLL